MKKLAIILSHPIQYYAPWFRHISQDPSINLKVFYLWNFGISRQVDAGFKQPFQWDIPLLEGYESEFVPNISSNPGTHHFWGLQNPTLIQQVRCFAPHAVLLMNYNYASLYHFLLRWNTRKIPLLFRGDSHRLLSETGVKSLLRRAIISQVYRRISACLYVGKANYGYFRHHGVHAQRLFHSPHAVENQRFYYQSKRATQDAIQWKQSLGIPNHHRVVLFAGKFTAVKRPEDLLRAFIKAQLNDVSLLFVGAGTLEERLNTEAKGEPNIYFAPFQNQMKMPRTYAVADLVVLPSYSETWGLAINEAMCLRKPVIVSSHVGCAQDLVHPGQNGLIFPAGDIQALSQCLRQAFRDPIQLQTWGQASYQIIQHYSYAQATQGLQAALQAVL